MAALVAVYRDLRIGGITSVLAAIALAGQIVCEVLLLGQPNQPTAAEYCYLAIALLMAVFGILAHNDDHPIG